MNRRTFLNITAQVGLTAHAARGQTSAKPNVILILADDQGYGDLSCHGNPVLKTPHMDRLHAESARFTDFHVAPMCTPTRGQLMTGRDALYNQAMNVSSGRTMLRRDLPTMADVFSASGYRTGIFGKWHLGDNYPYRPEDRGFHEAVWFPSSHIGSAGDYWNNDYFNDTYKHNGKRRRYEGYCTDVFFGEATKWLLEQNKAGRPFFAYIPLNAPHGPLFVPEQYKKPYANQPPNVASFFGMIANLDENIGKLEETLKSNGLRENTILIFMTDNGATNGFNVHNAGMRGRKIGLWDGGHRVPFFLRWPKGGIKPGVDINELTCAQDVLPTLIDLCGLKAPEGTGFDGVSLAGLIRGKAKPPDRMVVVQFSRMNLPRPQWGDAAVLWRKWRLVSNSELYDVAADPGQQKNVIAQHPGVAAKMRAHYDQWWRNIEPRLDSFLPIHLGSDKENPVQLSPTDWADSFLDQGNQVRAGIARNGVWHVLVEQDGEYEFTLRRWPREMDAPMRAGLPPHKGEVGQYTAGVAMPIARADIEAGGRTLTKAVGPLDREAVFRMQLSEGRMLLKTWFFDDAGRELSGAYFVYAELLPRKGR
jgi:arylsulfatase